jgi:hypothetical protein
LSEPRQVDGNAFEGEVSPEEARLETEFAGIAVRAAFDGWAELTDAGHRATLGETYQRVREQLGTTAGTSRIRGEL